MKVVTVEEMRRIEAASDAAGHSYAAMMEQAGQAVAQAIAARYQVRECRVLILVGPGNNGGDGLVAARHLAASGASVACYLSQSRDPSKDDNLRQAQERGLPIILAADDQGWGKLRRLARDADIVVDALLGTGARPPLRGALSEILSQTRETLIARRKLVPRPTLVSLTAPIPSAPAFPVVVAVDGPSGMDYDSGALDEAVIPADLTVTFAYPKSGHFGFPAAGVLGELVVADIGIDPALADDVLLEVVDPEMARAWFPPRPLDAHKGVFGRALIVAGSVNYTGAAYLAAAAAIRTGVGLATLALPGAIHSAVAARLAEATYVLLPHDLGVVAAEAAPVVAEKARGYDALLVGPGLGQERKTRAFLEALLGGGGRRPLGFMASEGGAPTDSLPPLIVDADGLNILAGIDNWPQRLPSQTILTPHPGEMARLMGCATREVQANRLSVAQAQAAAWGHIVVLKGAYTVVAAPSGRTVIEPFATPGLATAGSGDVLAGAIVALRAQGLDAFEAAAGGAYLHGLAGEMAQAEIGVAGMLAGDVLARLPRARARLCGRE